MSWKKKVGAVAIDRDVTDLVDHEQRRLGKELPLLIESSLSEGLAERCDETGGRGEECPDTLFACLHAESDSQMRLAHARRSEQQHVVAALDVAAGREFADHLRIDRGLELEVEALERLVEREARHAGAHRQVLLGLGAHLDAEHLIDEVGVGELALCRLLAQRREFGLDPVQAQALAMAADATSPPAARKAGSKCGGRGSLGFPPGRSKPA